ncbi:MAG: ASCH domain-containing protein [Candidatus Nanoarchaeia archaeon]
MDHIAIVKKSWNVINKILAGQKKIESRWYKVKTAPWNRIKGNDVVYFKNSGEPVTIKADVEKVLQFEYYNEVQLKEILNKYGSLINFHNSETAFEWTKDKRHCILVFLKNPERITPFEIDKTGFGNACAWMCVENIEKVKR